MTPDEKRQHFWISTAAIFIKATGRTAKICLYCGQVKQLDAWKHCPGEKVGNKPDPEKAAKR